VKSKSAGNTRGFQPVDYLKITILGFAMSALWQSMHTIILPLRLLDFVPESEKNTYLGMLTFTGLLLAMVVQPIAGAISDHSSFRWGRRRPFILLGVTFLLLLLPGIGLAGSYAAIFIIYCLLQVSSNTAQGPYQGFIPDLVPQGKRGLASGIKTFLEIAGGAVSILLISVFMDRYSTGGGSLWLWLSLAIPGAVLLGIMVITLFAVREQPSKLAPQYVTAPITRPLAKAPPAIPGITSRVRSVLTVNAAIIVATVYFLITSIALIHHTADKSSLWLPLAIVGSLLLIVMLATMFLFKGLPFLSVPQLSLVSVIYKPFKIDLRANRVFIWFLVSRTLIFMAFSTIQQFALYFLRDVIGVTNPAAAAATFSVVAVIGMLIAVYPAGRLSDRIGRKPIGVLSGLLMALAMMIVIFTREYTYVLIAAGVIGMAVGAFTSTNWALAVDLVARGEEARYLGLANMATAGGGALSRLIGPVITFFEKQSTGLGYQVMLIACCIYCLAGALMLLKIKPMLNR
jgi:Na+/melibiose symporter-like transporter